MSDILFVKTSSLGDVIHNMPAVSDVRKVLPKARITWIVEEAFAPLVRLHPGVDNVIPVASRRWRKEFYKFSSWREMRDFTCVARRQIYDTIIDTQGLFRSAVITKLVQGRRHGYDLASAREPISTYFYDVRHNVSRDLHAIERNRILTARALNYAHKGEPDYGLDQRRLSGSGHDRYAVLLPSTAQPRKEWPEHFWREIGRGLEEQGLELVIPWGTELERRRSERIAAGLSRVRIPQRQSLDKVAQLIAGAALVVGVDTGLMHLAAGLRVPLVAIFVGSKPGLTGPIGSGPIKCVGDDGQSPSVDVVSDAISQVAAK
ncbi:MAG TPA: lipopolysaccharide heptosyltransferase I [Xanthobacteraceae bacterium]|jgi:heptosyltransferase-1|nr:lipopolysaccharide heptosyltransferase I [Xanthobacteraceae bacterium]